MKIRNSYLLSFLPIFIILGTLSSTLQYSLIRKHLIWGIEEQAKSVALGIAAFLDHNPTRGAHQDSSPISSELLKRASRVLEQQAVVGFRIVTFNSEKPFYVPETKVDHFTSLPLPQLKELQTRPMVDVRDARSTGEQHYATAPIFDSSHSIVGAVQVIIDSSMLMSTLRTTRNNLLLQALAISLLALPIGYIFGRRLSAQLTRTFQYAEALEKNNSIEAMAPTGVCEMDHVNDSIGILASLLEEQSERQERQLVAISSSEMQLASLHTQQSDSFVGDGR